MCWQSLEWVWERDEVTLTISKERFEEFIAPFMNADDDIELASRPREGDLVFFPLGQRLFEIKWWFSIFSTRTKIIWNKICRTRRTFLPTRQYLCL